MPGFDWNIHLPLNFGRDCATALTLARSLPGEVQRPVFETYVSQRFQQVHGATIRQFMPELFGLSDPQGALCAVALAGCGDHEAERKAQAEAAASGGVAP